MKDKLILIDGNSLFHRAFYALPILMTSDGVYTNAVYGFTTMLLKLLEEEKTDYIITAFDRKEPTFRHKEYAEYKGHRARTPDELNSQFPILKKLLLAFNINILEAEGYEADDIIGTISRKAEDMDIETLIVTGDKDALQLVSPYTKVLLTRKGISELERYNEEKVFTKYGISPDKLVDVMGLMGDPSDNIPGVPNVGEKTAIKLIKQFGSFENIFNNIGELKGKLRENLENYKEQAFMSRRLAEICKDVPVRFDLKESEFREKNYEETIKLFKELEFLSLIDRIHLPSSNDNNIGSKTLKSIQEIETALHKIKKSGIMAVSFETEKSSSIEKKILGLSFGSGEQNIYFISGKTLEKTWAIFRSVFEDCDVKKICHDAKEVYILLNNEGIKLNGLEMDTLIGAYLLDPSKTSYSLEKLSLEFLNYYIESKPEDLKYNSCKKTEVQIKLKEIILSKLKDTDTLMLFKEIEMPLIKVLADMELAGIKVDLEGLEILSKEFGERLDILSRKIYDSAKLEFNINSPKQLGEVLFEKLGLPVIKKTKTGYSTDGEVLNKLRNHHEIVELVLEYRSLMKLKSTYVDGLISITNKNTRKVHTSFNQTITATGRISSTEPNLQNIPVRFELGREIRKVFKPENEGNYLVAADYSQIELRILAHISRDENLINAFINGEDIHANTASKVFDVKLEDVTPIMRDKAKAVNFGIVYGISDYGLSQDLGISRKEAQQYIDSYFEKYPGVRDYIRETIKKAGVQGYVTTIMNRRRYLPDLHSRNRNIRSFAERTAINTPIQGSAADIIKIAMNKIYRNLKNEKLYTKMILQVHDELIFDVPADELSKAGDIIKKEMEEVYPLRVPLKVDLKKGHNWYDMIDFGR